MSEEKKPKLHRQAPQSVTRARRLRQDAPVPERLLWQRLRAGQLDGVKIRRQHPIGPYVADFYCPKQHLVIELDGCSHDDREEYDATRTQYMEARGLRVIRFHDDEVVRSLDDVMTRIAAEVGVEYYP